MPNPGDNKSVPAGAVPAKPAEIRTFANFLETRGPDSEQYVSGLGDPGGRECAENPGPDGRPCACCIRYSRKPGRSAKPFTIANAALAFIVSAALPLTCSASTTSVPRVRFGRNS